MSMTSTKIVWNAKHAPSSTCKGTDTQHAFSTKAEGFDVFDKWSHSHWYEQIWTSWNCLPLIHY